MRTTDLTQRNSGIIAFFNQNYIRTEKIAVEFFRILTGAETIRNDSDYDDFYSPAPEQALKQLENARVFVKMIQTYISAQMD